MSRIRSFAIESYRSLRRVEMELANITVVVGPNGSGKTNLYRALKLVSGGARGRLLEVLASEGGMGSAAWAGPKPHIASRRSQVWLTTHSERLASQLAKLGDVEVIEVGKVEGATQVGRGGRD